MARTIHRALFSAIAPLLLSLLPFFWIPHLAFLLAALGICAERYGVPATSMVSGIVALALIFGQPYLAALAAVIGELTIAEALRRKLSDDPVASTLHSAVGGAAAAVLVGQAMGGTLHAIIFGLTIFAAFIRPPLAPKLYERRERYDPWNSIVLAALMLFGLVPLVGIGNACLAFLVAKGVDGSGGLAQFIPRSVNPVVSLEGLKVRRVEEGISPIGTLFEFLTALGLGLLITGSWKGGLAMGATVTIADVVSNVTGVEKYHKGDDLLMTLAAAWTIHTFGTHGLLTITRHLQG